MCHRIQQGYGDTLYYPHQSRYFECDGYWLAAPSADNAYDMMSVRYGGGVADYYYESAFGVRPLVSLKSGVTLQENSDGTVTLIK